ncbi:Nucleic-acid-binding protein from mobile element jockey [Eumeta japonica]|uniref:Nucleic-acid-binding protein from mobile element jockey n=1 Tax=Eumeta variegata TaxID=151549 RepID=A0A4C1W1F2_EUMVA|nr:Nucleic-acid-binding protein from mobile element jockey [Eumeta japonica]
MLESVASGDYEIKILQGERVKIQTKSPESYSTIYKELKNRSTEFFTYQPKQERSFRVVLKRIHPSTSTDDIKQALEDLHHKPNNIWNVKIPKQENPYPYFHRPATQSQ